MTMVNPKDDQGYTHWVCSVCGAPGQGWTDCPQCKRNNLLAEQNQMMAQQAKESERARRAQAREEYRPSPEFDYWGDLADKLMAIDIEKRKEARANGAKEPAPTDWSNSPELGTGSVKEPIASESVKEPIASESVEASSNFFMLSKKEQELFGPKDPPTPPSPLSKRQAKKQRAAERERRKQRDALLFIDYDALARASQDATAAPKKNEPTEEPELKDWTKHEVKQSFINRVINKLIRSF